MKRATQWLAFAVGIGLFALYLRGADLPAIGHRLRALGWGAVLLPLPYLVVYLVDTWAWRWAFATPPPVRFLALFRIRWCGESVNNIVPSAYVGGEALKAFLLTRHGVPIAEGTAAALVSKTGQTVGQVLFLAAGSAAFLAHAGDRPGLRAALATILVGGLAVVALLLWWQQRGVFRSILGLLGRVGIRSRRIEARRAQLLGMDLIITRFYGAHRSRFIACTALFLAGWFLDTIELWMVSHLLGMPLAWTQALAIESFIGVVKVVGLWVPGALGVQESGIVMLIRMAGGSDLLGATYALLRRARELAFAAVGWGLLFAAGDAVRAQKK